MSSANSPEQSNNNPQIATDCFINLRTSAKSAAERPHGRYSRTLLLNVPVEPDKAEAHFDNGLLTLKLPKAEAVKPRMIKVKAK